MKARKCVICGARVRNMNPRVNTCDSICTAAKHNGLTREEQTLKDIECEEKEKQLMERIYSSHIIDDKS